MDHLRRELAPVSTAAWAQIDEEGARTLRHFLAGRALIDFSGPHGWPYSAEPTGRVSQLTPPIGDGVLAGLRLVQPVVELRSGFELSRGELEAASRGASDVDLGALVEAARRLALAEDRAVFHGYAPAGIAGILPSSPLEELAVDDDYSAYPGVVARAVASLRRAGVGGPYAVALGPRCYTGVVETTEHGGYPVLEHIRFIVGGPVVWAPGVDGAAVLSVRGGDYELSCGEDFSIGYQAHSAETVELYLEESFVLRVNEPRAAVRLAYSA